jgi:tRNA (guanine37-N1)-methyltransferase
VFRGYEVPEVLLSGDHERIRKWRLLQSLLVTRSRRPDLFEKLVLSEEEKKLLDAFDKTGAMP